MPIPPAPEPARVYDYLTKHGWIPEDPEPDDGIMFTFHEPDDFGEPMTLLLPSSTEVVAYSLRIRDIVVTAAGLEDRSQEAVWADIWATPLPQPTASGAGSARHPRQSLRPRRIPRRARGHKHKPPFSFFVAPRAC